MQTFLPYKNFKESAAVLDRQRLGKQRVETMQLLKALSTGGGWSNHPAAKMWAGYEEALIDYGLDICAEWISRGYKDTCTEKIAAYKEIYNKEKISPHWLGDPAFHASHRSNLLKKNPDYYSQFGWVEPDDMPYIWPTKEKS